MVENMVKISKDDKEFLKTVEEWTTKSGDNDVLPLCLTEPDHAK